MRVSLTGHDAHCTTLLPTASPPPIFFLTSDLYCGKAEMREDRSEPPGLMGRCCRRMGRHAWVWTGRHWWWCSFFKSVRPGPCSSAGNVNSRSHVPDESSSSTVAEEDVERPAPRLCVALGQLSVDA